MSKLKKILPIALLLVLLLCCGISASAEVVSGDCGAEGNNVTYTLDTDTGALEISGAGVMTDYLYGSQVPWYSYRELIKTVTISEGVTSLGDYSFAWCENLQSIELPEGLTNIGRYAFCTCRSLQSINIPEGVLYIGDDTFFECSSLESVTLPERLTSIGDYAFYYCGSLQGIYIPENVTSIGDRAFSLCGQLTAINVDENNVSYSSLDGVLFDKEKTTLIAYPGGKEDISSYTILDSVTSIGIDAFKANFSLQSINIPETVSSIDETAFEDCRQLTAINVDDNNMSYSSRDGILFDKEKTTIVRYPCCKKDTSSYTIPDSVTSIGEGAFENCDDLRSIIIPEGVTRIGVLAFGHCDNLQSITIPEGVTSIGHLAFAWCESLRSITIPDSVFRIEGQAFDTCNNLTEVYYTGSAEDWATIFIGDYNESLTNAQIIFNYVSESISLNRYNVTNGGNGFLYSFTMKSKEPVMGVILVALYQGNELVGFATETIEAETTEFAVTGKAISAEKKPNQYKMFFWNNLSDVQPLCASISGQIS